MHVGESFVGSGPNAAHVNTVLGSRDGPVAAAWATALATPSTGHAPFVVTAQPNVPVQPFTLFVNKAAIAGEEHARLTWGAAQAGVAAGVIDAIESNLVTIPAELLLIAAVWVDPAASDEDEVFANNRRATYESLYRSLSNLPAAADVIAVKDDVWNAFFRKHE